MNDSKAAEPDFISVLVPAGDQPSHDAPTDGPRPRKNFLEPVPEYAPKPCPQIAPAEVPSLDDRRQTRSSNRAEQHLRQLNATAPDPSPMEQAIGALRARNIRFTRPSEHQLKIGKINYYPVNGRIYVDGAARSEANKYTLQMALEFIYRNAFDANA